MAFPVKITGTVYFSAYQYGQIAKIYVTVPGSSTEVDTGLTVIPIGTTNVGLFEYFAGAAGTYTFRAEARNATTGVVGGSSTFQKVVEPQPEVDLEALITAKNALGIAQQARAESGSGVDATARSDAATASNLAKTAVGIAQQARAASTTSGTDQTARDAASAASDLAKTAVGIAQQARAAVPKSLTVLEVQVFS